VVSFVLAVALKLEGGLDFWIVWGPKTPLQAPGCSTRHPTQKNLNDKER